MSSIQICLQRGTAFRRGGSLHPKPRLFSDACKGPHAIAQCSRIQTTISERDPGPITPIRRPALHIHGGQVLEGFAPVSGAKNSALVLMAACLLSKVRRELVPAESGGGGSIRVFPCRSRWCWMGFLTYATWTP